MGQIIQGRRRLRRKEFTTSGTFTVPAGVMSIQYLIASSGAAGSCGGRETGVMPVSPGQTLPVVIGGLGGGSSSIGYINTALRFYDKNNDPYYADSAHPIYRNIAGTWTTFSGPTTNGYCEIFWEE